MTTATKTIAITPTAETTPTTAETTPTTTETTTATKITTTETTTATIITTATAAIIIMVPEITTMATTTIIPQTIIPQTIIPRTTISQTTPQTTNLAPGTTRWDINYYVPNTLNNQLHGIIFGRSKNLGLIRKPFPLYLVLW